MTDGDEGRRDGSCYRVRSDDCCDNGDGSNDDAGGTGRVGVVGDDAGSTGGVIVGFDAVGVLVELA